MPPRASSGARSASSAKIPAGDVLRLAGCLERNRAVHQDFFDFCLALAAAGEDVYASMLTSGRKELARFDRLIQKTQGPQST